jgi:hypothetical protein
LSHTHPRFYVHSPPVSLHPMPTKPRLPPRPAAAFLALLLLLAAPAASAKPGLSGLQFPVGQPAEQTSAKVAIEEVIQGAQKRGFLKIALLPLASANGVQVHFLRPDPAVFLEITDTLRALTKLDAQEFNRIELFAPGETVPRFVAEQASPTPGGWTFKRARFHSSACDIGVPECFLSLGGPSAGRFSAKARPGEGSSGAPPALPTLAELLQAAP